MTEINYSEYNILSFSNLDITQRLSPDSSEKNDPFVEVDCGRTFHPTTFQVSEIPSGRPLSLFIKQHTLRPHFIASVLNSIVGETMLFDEDVQPNKRYVNKARLLKVKFLDIPRDVQVAIGRCNEVLQLINQLPSNFSNARFFGLVEKRFRMLQNLLVAEMYCQNKPAFRDVCLIGVWMSYAERLENPTLDSIALMYADIFSPESTIRSKLEVIASLFKLA